VGIGLVRILQKLGHEIIYDFRQTCCGQPAYNTGYTPEALRLAKNFIHIFQDAEYIITPSGSCCFMVKKTYHQLPFPDSMIPAVESISSRIYEFSDFLVNQLKITDVGSKFTGNVTYHDSCHSKKELNVYREPRKLLEAVSGINFIEMEESDRCCGFGGTFSIKFDHISSAMGLRKVQAIEKTRVNWVVSNDVSCLMQINGILRRSESHISTIHLTEVLATGIDT
jgi:L-lactate dehydrogenase complex protein LldE